MHGSATVDRWIWHYAHTRALVCIGPVEDLTASNDKKQILNWAGYASSEKIVTIKKRLIENYRLRIINR